MVLELVILNNIMGNRGQMVNHSRLAFLPDAPQIQNISWFVVQNYVNFTLITLRIIKPIQCSQYKLRRKIFWWNMYYRSSTHVYHVFWKYYWNIIVPIGINCAFGVIISAHFRYFNFHSFLRYIFQKHTFPIFTRVMT